MGPVHRRRIIVIVALALLVAAPITVFDSSYSRGVLINVVLFAGLGIAWNIISGFGGQLSIGHAAFFGIGAYTSTLLYMRLGVTPWIGMIPGALLAAAFGMALGYPSFKVSGIAFKMITFVSALILEVVARYYHTFTGGDVGLNIPLRGSAPWEFQFESYATYYYVVLVMAIGCYLVSRRVVRSRFGLALMSLRDDQLAAQTAGIDALKTKLAGFALSAALTAMLGTFYAQYTLFIDPRSTFGILHSVKIAIVGIVGGIGTVVGPILGAAFLIPFAEWANSTFQSSVGMDKLVYGLALILVATVLPTGLVRLPEKLARVVRGAKPAGRDVEAAQSKAAAVDSVAATAPDVESGRGA